MTNLDRALFDSITAIDEAYVDEAAAPGKQKERLIRVTALAATVALVILSAIFFPRQSTPFLAVHANATTISNVGDILQIPSGTYQTIFPGKQTYSFDVSLENYTGDMNDFLEGYFFFIYHQTRIYPGQSNENLSIDWNTTADGTLTGYHITGWCEERDYLDIAVHDRQGNVIHDLSLCITFENGTYQIKIDTSYVHEEDLPTDELIDRVLNQDYYFTIGPVSDPSAAYSFLVNGRGGFAELEQRPDAPGKLLERYVRIMNGEELYNSDDWLTSSDWIVGLMLSRDVYWEQLTQEEKEIFAGFGMWRELDSPDQDKTIFDTRFPGKEIFSYEIRMDGENFTDYSLTVEYNGTSTQTEDDHILILSTLSASWEETPFFGWMVNGWFDEPTDVTFTVTGKDGDIVRQETVRITCNNGYHYEVLPTAP